MPADLVATLALLLKIPDPATIDVRRFTREVAKLGGFLGRKHDGEPGWQTLWRGWQKLSDLHAGYQLARQHQEEGERYG